MSRVMVAMSGGVDSSVAAYLLKREGHELVGVTMKLFEKNHTEGSMHSCCTKDDIADAKKIAEKFGFPHYVRNFAPEFDEKVIAHFVESYEAGLTPNPCIHCNKNLKFGHLYAMAEELGCEYIATGHYARIFEENGRYGIKKGLDAKKDQSYILHMLSQEQLAHILLPLGELEKTEVRAIAEEAGLLVAHKKDSQDICFIDDGDYKAFLEDYRQKSYPPGDILTTSGKVVGRHEGAVGYTIGQRKGLGVSLGHPAYVTGKDMAANTVTLGTEADLYKGHLRARGWNWVSMPAPGEAITVSAMTKYHGPETEGVLSFNGDEVVIRFSEKKRAMTPGQGVVAYEGDVLLGGGIIEEVW